MSTTREKIENNLTLTILSVLLAGFLAGIGTFKWGLETFKLEISTKSSLCPKGRVKLTVDSFPINANTIIKGNTSSFHQGICLKSGRYELITSAKGYSPKGSIIQLDNSDLVAIVNLEPIKTIVLKGNELRKYDGQPFTIVANEVDLKSAISALGEAGNIKFIFNEVEGILNLEIEDIPWDQALDVILLMHSLSIKEIEPKLFIVTGKKDKENVIE
ncbi:MAG: hypothetical protein MJK12_17555 [Colwellia sp.]|nr:hypothetical protein [Colwellia sp.]